MAFAEQAERWGLVNRVVEPSELLAVCRALAADMVSCDPTLLRKYKAVIDEGYAATFKEGMKLEARRSVEQAKNVTPAAIEERRRAVIDRGRAQKK